MPLPRCSCPPLPGRRATLARRPALGRHTLDRHVRDRRAARCPAARARPPTPPGCQATSVVGQLMTALREPRRITWRESSTATPCSCGPTSPRSPAGTATGHPFKRAGGDFRAELRAAIAALDVVATTRRHGWGCRARGAARPPRWRRQHATRSPVARRRPASPPSRTCPRRRVPRSGSSGRARLGTGHPGGPSATSSPRSRLSRSCYSGVGLRGPRPDPTVLPDPLVVIMQSLVDVRLIGYVITPVRMITRNRWSVTELADDRGEDARQPLRRGNDRRADLRRCTAPPAAPQVGAPGTAASPGAARWCFLRTPRHHAAHGSAAASQREPLAGEGVHVPAACPTNNARPHTAA